VLWHTLAEGRTATEVGPLLGRSANDVNATLLGAEAGLFELYLRADAARISDLDSTSAALLPLIGGHRRGVLSPMDRLRVDDLLERRTEGSPDGLHAQRWMAVGASLDSMIPNALVPGLVGQSPDWLVAVLGAAGTAVGAAELAAARSERVQRSARIGAVAAIIVAILGAAFLIRNPFDGLSASLISELIAADATPGDDGSNTDDTGTDGTGTDGADDVAAGADSVPPGQESTDGTVGVDGPDGSNSGADTVDDRVDLVFPGARQGAVYVPGQELLQLRAVIRAESDFVAGGTGTLSAAITNDAATVAHVRFDIRATAGIRLVPSGDGAATCRSVDNGTPSCSFTLLPGSTTTLTLVLGLDETLVGDLTIVPTIPGAALRVPIV
jgi:hypothetical protein